MECGYCELKKMIARVKEKRRIEAIIAEQKASANAEEKTSAPVIEPEILPEEKKEEVKATKATRKKKTEESVEE